MATKTLAELRSDFYIQIDETEANSHITTVQANEFINKSIRNVAIKTHHPRKFDTGTQVTVDDADYDCASDFLYLVGAYFGDPEVAGDKVPLEIVREGNIKYLNRNWLDRTDSSQGRPERLVFVDRNTFILDPRPNTAESVTGKKVWLYYAYIPAALSSDSETPDIPDAYHDSIPYYAAYLAYIGKLNNAQMADSMRKIFYSEIGQTAESAEEEAQELMRFQWGFRDE